MESASLIQIWITILLMVFTYSYLFAENPLYRAAEHVYVGAAAGHFIVMGLASIRSNGIMPLLGGNLAYAVPLVLGIVLFTSFSRKHYWASRYPVAIIVGIGTGLALRGTPKGQILDQIVPTLTIVAANAFTTFSNVVLLVAVVAPITYFIFTREQKGPLAVSGRLGRYFMLGAFGTIYAGAIATRIVMVFAQVQLIIDPRNIAATIVALIIVTAMFIYLFRKQKKV